MRSRDELDLVEALDREGLNRCEIARRTGIPRSTVRDWLTEKAPRRPLYRDGTCCKVCGNERHDFARLPIPEYTYLLGMYLGDGCISETANGVLRLRIYLDLKYPGIIERCGASITAVMPHNRVGVRQKAPDTLCAEVSCYSKSWACLLPQHGPGPKHLRAISLERWQRTLIDQDPKPLLAGLIHSDGCRVINRSMGRLYVRYMFTNESTDIRRIFCDACDQLAIPWRQPKANTISIARRAGVETLDAFLGPKS